MCIDVYYVSGGNMGVLNYSMQCHLHERHLRHLLGLALGACNQCGAAHTCV